MKLNKKGFTLIELLAVITILAVVTVITITVSLSSVKTSKQKTVSVEAKDVAKWISEQLTLLELNKTNDVVKEALNTLKSNKETWHCLGTLGLGYNGKDSLFTEAGLSDQDYKIGTDVYVPDTVSDTTCSSVRLNSKGEPEVLLIANKNGKLAIGDINYAFSNKELDNVQLEESTSEFSICGVTKQDNIPTLTTSNVVTYGNIKSLGGYEGSVNYKITIKDSKGNVKGTITLNQPLRGFSNYSDCLKCTKKKCWVNRNINKYTFMGTEAWGTINIAADKIAPSKTPSIITNVSLSIQALRIKGKDWYTNEIWSNVLPSARVVNWENNQEAHFGTWVKHHGIYYEGNSATTTSIKARIYNDGSPSVTDFNNFFNTNAYFLYVEGGNKEDPNVTLSNNINLYSGSTYTAVDDNDMSVNFTVD